MQPSAHGQEGLGVLDRRTSRGGTNRVRKLPSVPFDVPSLGTLESRGSPCVQFEYGQTFLSGIPLVDRFDHSPTVE